MKRMRYLSAVSAVGALLLAGLLVSPASAATTTGTWSQYPTGVASYQAQVQQPINTANTSNWSSKSKGGIPVMFKLGTSTGPAAFESIGSDPDTTNDFAFVSFTPDPGITFNDITNLSTDYAFTLGNCNGGALRWSVRVSATQSVFIYYGDAPNFTNCTTNSQSGTNMIGLSDLRYDTSQVGGTFYDTYANAQALVGTENVIRVSLVLDGGWAGNQRATISNTTVNDNSYDFVSAPVPFSQTCNLPAATIQVTQLAPDVNGSINEATVQPSLVDTNQNFRVVDCKYQYVLSIPSLQGTGKYQVEILIGTASVPTPGSPGGIVTFDIK